MNVYIISRTESKLAELAKELETKYGVQTKHLAVDFSEVMKLQFPLLLLKPGTVSCFLLGTPLS